MKNNIAPSSSRRRGRVAAEEHRKSGHGDGGSSCDLGLVPVLGMISLQPDSSCRTYFDGSEIFVGAVESASERAISTPGPGIEEEELLESESAPEPTFFVFQKPSRTAVSSGFFGSQPVIAALRLVPNSATSEGERGAERLQPTAASTSGPNNEEPPANVVSSALTENESRVRERGGESRLSTEPADSSIASMYLSIANSNRNRSRSRSRRRTRGWYAELEEAQKKVLLCGVTKAYFSDLIAAPQRLLQKTSSQRIEVKLEDNKVRQFFKTHPAAVFPPGR